jgi:hypothetical protein
MNYFTWGEKFSRVTTLHYVLSIASISHNPLISLKRDITSDISNDETIREIIKSSLCHQI